MDFKHPKANTCLFVFIIRPGILLLFLLLSVCGWKAVAEEKGPPADVLQTNRIPVITEAILVKSLNRDEAEKNLPVKIRGVITARLGGGFVIQDASWSVFFRLKDNPLAEDRTPSVGDYAEVEGVTDMGFAPGIAAARWVYLGEGVFPEPLKPSWDELFNGSMDTQYVEIEGVVSLVEQSDLVLLTRAGKIRIQLLDEDPEQLTTLDGARIRLRGVFSPERNESLLMLPRLRLSTVSILVDRPAPEAPFEIPLMRAEDLFHFDVRADLLRRVRISGQVLQHWNGEYFLMDGPNGFRLELKMRAMLHAGDQLEVVGFPDVSGFSPVLRDAQIRKTGQAELPAPRRLSADTLLNGENDATRIYIEADVMGLSEDQDGQVLELRVDKRGFRARLKKEDGRLKNILPDSRVRITGIYIGKGSGREVDSFELLLNSPDDVIVLERPSWWTARHALNLAKGLALLSLGSLVWIIILRRQVESRSRQLAVEIRRREQTERRQAMEEERTRIAQDLHDDLGATLTEIRFLSAVGCGDSDVSPEIRKQFQEVSEKSRQMVASLDEIVWAVNPANDSLTGLESYLHHVVDEFFRGTPIRCRLDVDDALPNVMLNSEVRHNLYLAVREALNNIAKHAEAAEAWLRIRWSENILHITVEDNGCGFSVENADSSGNGLQNMRQRLEKIGGHFECEARPGDGTVCRMTLPLEQTELEE